MDLHLGEDMYESFVEYQTRLLAGIRQHGRRIQLPDDRNLTEHRGSIRANQEQRRTIAGSKKTQDATESFINPQARMGGGTTKPKPDLRFVVPAPDFGQHIATIHKRTIEGVV